MMDPIDHTRNRGGLEDLLRKIPGFRGYLEKEARRDSDHLQRTMLADRLQLAKSALDRHARRLVDAGQLATLPKLEQVRARLDKVQNRLRGAVRGYSGFFDLVQVDEAVLDRVYEHDATLVDDVDAFVQGVETWNDDQSDSQTATLEGWLAELARLDRLMDERSRILEGLK
jgi:DNA-binding transcriptional ArsR family regulator